MVVTTAVRAVVAAGTEAARGTVALTVAVERAVAAPVPGGTVVPAETPGGTVAVTPVVAAEATGTT